MKTLLIMRHAKSSWSNQGMGDHERPLNGRGKVEAPQMGTLLKQEELTPDLIISSTAERAYRTAEAVALACDYEGTIERTRSFYHAEIEEIVERAQQVDNNVERLLVVAHNPGMQELVAHLTGVDDRFTTANIVQVSLPIDSWAQFTTETEGELVNWWRPREV